MKNGFLSHLNAFENFALFQQNGNFHENVHIHLKYWIALKSKKSENQYFCQKLKNLIKKKSVKMPSVFIEFFFGGAGDVS